MDARTAAAPPQPEPNATTSARVAEDLLAFAIDRQDIKWCVAHLPADDALNPVAIDYELQILKIISVGWSLTYLMADKPHKTSLVNLFWNAVQEFSEHLSHTSGLMIGRDFDYFKVLKQRFDLYLEAMTATGEQNSEPGRVIGEVFARLCGHPGDLATMMAGARMLTNTLARVSKYLTVSGCYE